MQKTLIVVALLVCVGFSATVDLEELSTLWGAWKGMHSKTYGAGEEGARFAIFVENYKKIIKFNAEHESPKLGLNIFADLTAEEFKNYHASCAFTETDESIISANTEAFNEEGVQGVLPTSVDWRTKNAVTPIKNQQQCGSCWTFSTTGVLEGFHAISSGTLLSFSEQQIVDCDTGSYGCDGGWPYQALTYTAQNGIELESQYPYTAADGTCQFNSANAQTVNKGYTFVVAKNRLALKYALTKSPVSVTIEADQDVFQLYTSGVISSDCGDANDHAVLAVGYDNQNNQEYFIVKNSWGTSWGISGYVYISTDPSQNGGTGVCGIYTQPAIAK